MVGKTEVGPSLETTTGGGGRQCMGCPCPLCNEPSTHSRRCSKGNVVLMGDAVHPMMPNLGQGGCQAIEERKIFTALRHLI